MAYAEEKIADALQRGDTRAAEYWRHVYAAAYTGAPRVDGQPVELRAIFATTPRRKAPAVSDTPQDPKPLPTRVTRRAPLSEMVDAKRPPKIAFNSSI